MIDVDWLRKTCLPLPGVTEQIQWGYDLVVKVGGKMFAVAPLEPAPVCLSFKCSDESLAELTYRCRLEGRHGKHFSANFDDQIVAPLNLLGHAG